MLGIDSAAILASISVQAFLAVLLLRKWLRKHNNPKAVLIIFLTISCLLLALSVLGVTHLEHAKLGLLGPAAAFIAVAALFDPLVKRWSVTAYSLIVLTVLILPYPLIMKIIALILAIGSLILSGLAYVKTRNTGMLYFALGIIIFMTLGATSALEIIPSYVHMIGVTVGVILWTIPFVRGS